MSCARNSLAVALLGMLLGCTTASTTNTARTSTEQLLVANAVDQALDKVNFTSFAGYDIFLQEKYVDCVDKTYVIASTRHRLLKAGARLVASAEEADAVVELRAGAIGTASANSFIGIPEITLPGLITTPEVRFVERRRQEGSAKIGLVAYDPKTNQILGDGGVSLARADDSNWYVVGIGPYQNGSVKEEVHRSTTGPAAVPQSRLPITVAFEAPYHPPETQLADEPATPPVQQAAGDGEFQPVWTESGAR